MLHIGNRRYGAEREQPFSRVSSDCNQASRAVGIVSRFPVTGLKDEMTSVVKYVLAVLTRLSVSDVTGSLSIPFQSAEQGNSGFLSADGAVGHAGIDPVFGR